MNWLTALNASRRSAACGEAKNCTANKQQHQIFRILVYHCQKQQQHKSQRNFISYQTTCLLPARDRSFLPSRLSNNTNNTGNSTPVVKVFLKAIHTWSSLGRNTLIGRSDRPDTSWSNTSGLSSHICQNGEETPTQFLLWNWITTHPPTENLSSLLSALDWFYNPSQCFRIDAASLLAAAAAAAAPLQIFLFRYSTKDHKLKILTKTCN